MGRIEQLIGVTANTGIKLYRDVSINSGTQALFDVSSAWAGGAVGVAAGASIKSLSFENSVATFAKPHTYANGGMVFAGVQGDTFDLPDVAAPQPGDTHWMITAWLKIANFGVGTAGNGNNQTLSFSTVANNLATSAMLTLVPSPVAGATPTSISLFVRGKNYGGLASQLGQLYNGNLHQLSIEFQLSSDGTQQQVTVYIDGSVVYASGYGSVAATVPSAPTSKYIGASSTFLMAWSGAFYRYRKDDMTMSTLTASQILSADSSSINGRFS
ncbi:hypothetical protein [Sodalis sp. RH16]|uniref:hypothetical protein n=1 Tax=Sodalis sp. RH16 TaxID=3394331 RepID=UPI0039B52A53